MFMFLPFLLVLGTALSSLSGNRTLCYVFWSITLVVVVLSFKHHVTDALSLSF